MKRPVCCSGYTKECDDCKDCQHTGVHEWWTQCEDETECGYYDIDVKCVSAHVLDKALGL